MYLCPIIYPMSTVAKALSPTWQFIYSANPMVAVVVGFRWAVLGGEAPRLGAMLAGVFATGSVLAGGLVIFRRTERELADIV